MTKLPEILFRKSLERFLPRQDDPYAAKKIIREASFPEISQLLNDYGKPKWSLLPRTFAVLLILGIPEKLNDFIAEGRNDYAIPYNHGNLPDTIKGSVLRNRFLHVQAAVRGRQEGVTELEEGGRHLYLNGNADMYFYSMRTLGSGRFGKVDAVRSWQTAKIYARKQILRGDSVSEDQSQLLAFEKEIKSLKNLTHHHVVKLVGSYTDATSLGLIMSPVADMDLHAYLESKEVEPSHKKRMLRSYFGCLATALAYIHSENIRHKDIKPNNILVKDDKVLLSDFGTSRTWIDGHLTSNGVSREGTPRYWAPEVGDGDDRNTASDVWSLGCVFLEMATTLFGYSHYDMLGFYSKSGTENLVRISLNEEATRLWIRNLRDTTPGVDADVLEWTSAMLRSDQIERPTAAQLRGRILDCKSDHNYICLHCSVSNIKRRQSNAHKSSPPQRQDARPDTQKPQIGGGAIESDTQKLLYAEGNDGIPPENSPLPTEQETPSNSSYELSDDRPNCSVSATDAKGKPQVGPFVSENRTGKKHARLHFDGDISDRVFRTDDRRVASERFVGLPPDRRPEPTRRKPQEEEEEEAEFVIPDPIGPPPLHRRNIMPLPKASVVPSYILAGTNHFSRDEIYAKHGNRTMNVFVYGRLMFPPVLRYVARRSLGGGYAPHLQRRLLPLDEDWLRASLSVQHTSEIMTPALLRGYDRWRPSRLDCAVIQRSSVTPEILKRRERSGYKAIQPSGHVVGFLLVGVEMEAVRWLDLLFAFSEQNLRKLDLVKEEARREGTVNTANSPLRRDLLTVEVELNDGEMAQIDAYTYVWKHGATDLWEPWIEDRFVREYRFQGIFRDNNAEQEEKPLAAKMKMSFSLIGDLLCATVVTGDTKKLEHLLGDGWDPDGPCRFYGTALQAAIAVGSDAMVRVLLEHGANVNYKGGRYGTALIAAAFASRKTITRTLLNAGGDVFATHETHINALYQAVGHADYAVAEMLLEHGSWLIEDWCEVVDLAAEMRDTEVIDLLAQYDVRQIHQQKMLTRYGVMHWGDVAGGRRRSGNIIMAVIKKGAAVQAMAGNWRGRKGVAVAVAALGEGASPSILPLLRNVINPIRLIIENLRKSDALADGITDQDIYGDSHGRILGTVQDGDADVLPEQTRRSHGGGHEGVERRRRRREREKDQPSLRRWQQHGHDDGSYGYRSPKTGHAEVRRGGGSKSVRLARE